MKRLLTILILTVVLITCLASCGEENAGRNDGKVTVVATIFPEYDWAREIAGPGNDKVDISLLVNNGADLHSYQPTVDDIMKISSSDIFIYVGGESDEWVEEVLERAENSDTKVVCLMDILGDRAKEEEAVEGMEDHEHDGHEEEHEEEYDEHVWLSVRNAELFCEAIRDALAEKDGDNRDRYAKNTEEYIEKLRELDSGYTEAVKGAENDVLVFGDRFPFRYLTDDYGIRYYAAFTGCSAETEASFETVRFLADKVDEFGLNYIMTIDGTDGSIARTVAENTKAKDQEILALDSMQSVTEKEIESGRTYIGIMKKDLEVLEKALGR